MSIQTARRTHGFRESVIRGMTRLAREHDAINLAQGFPNFPAPELLKEAAARAIRDDINQYAITWGAQHAPRGARAQVRRAGTGWRRDPDREITVTCGATEAMIATLLAVVNPGDEVIVFEPFYENYGPDTILADARPVYVPLEPGQPLDLDRLAGRVHRRAPAPSSSTRRAIRRAGCSREPSWRRSATCASGTTRSRSPTRSTSTSATRASTSPSPRCRGCASGPSRSAARPRPSASPAGGSAGSWRRPSSPTRSGRSTTSSPSARRRRCRRRGGRRSTRWEERSTRARREYRRRRDLLHSALVDAGFGCLRPEGAYYILADYTALGPQAAGNRRSTTPRSPSGSRGRSG